MKLSLLDLASALNMFSDYWSVDVFADDLADAARAAANTDIQMDGRPYRLEIFPVGVARFTRADSPATTGALAGAAGGAVGGAVAKGWTGLLFGLLIGGTVGGAAGALAGPTREVFALQFDPAAQQWKPYDGGLLPAMKQQLMGSGS